VFFTNLESRKAREITGNPRVSLLFLWLPLARQLSITGKAERVSALEALAYFAKRPFASQLAAWASPQSRIISTRSILEAKWEEMKRKFNEGAVPLPSFWGGYRVVPHEFEFWSGREHRLHDRFLYRRRTDGLWNIQRLAP
jgi:pyridoxamine 5'-phosphate oxidase